MSLELLLLLDSVDLHEHGIVACFSQRSSLTLAHITIAAGDTVHRLSALLRIPLNRLITVFAEWRHQRRSLIAKVYGHRCQTAIIYFCTIRVISGGHV